MPTPYSPVSLVDIKIIKAIHAIGITTDCIPTDRPVIITVAGPVCPDSAILIIGFEPV